MSSWTNFVKLRVEGIGGQVVFEVAEDVFGRVHERSSSAAEVVHPAVLEDHPRSRRERGGAPPGRSRHPWIIPARVGNGALRELSLLPLT